VKGLTDGQSSSEPGIEVDPTSPTFHHVHQWYDGFPERNAFLPRLLFVCVYGMTLEGDLMRDDRVLVCLPSSIMEGSMQCSSPRSWLGGHVSLSAGGLTRIRSWMRCARHRVTLTMWVPTQLAMLINHPRVTGYDLSTLKKIWYGSSAITPTTLEASMEVFKAGFYQWYGQVETGNVSVLRPEDHLEPVPVHGREMFNADLRIVDEEGRIHRWVRWGEIISAQKPLGMIGYYRMEEATKERFAMAGFTRGPCPCRGERVFHDR